MNNDADKPELHGWYVRKLAKKAVQQIEVTGATNILLEGPPGCGKEMIADHISHALRHKTPDLKYNLATAPENLVQAQLFGHVEGAFTGATTERKGRFGRLQERAVCFLDEIGLAPQAIHANLLRIVEYGDYYRVGEDKPQELPDDIMLIAALGRGSMPPDLRDRFELTYQIPGLLERATDVPPLVASFVEQFNDSSEGENIEMVSANYFMFLMERAVIENAIERENKDKKSSEGDVIAVAGNSVRWLRRAVLQDCAELARLEEEEGGGPIMTEPREGEEAKRTLVPALGHLRRMGEVTHLYMARVKPQYPDDDGPPGCVHILELLMRDGRRKYRSIVPWEKLSYIEERDASGIQDDGSLPPNTLTGWDSGPGAGHETMARVPVPDEYLEEWLPQVGVETPALSLARLKTWNDGQFHEPLGRRNQAVLSCLLRGLDRADYYEEVGRELACGLLPGSSDPDKEAQMPTRDEFRETTERIYFSILEEVGETNQEKADIADVSTSTLNNCRKQYGLTGNDAPDDG